MKTALVAVFFICTAGVPGYGALAAEAEEVEPLVVEVVPTKIIPAPSAAGALPEAYRPPDSSPPPIVNQLIFGLIGTGLVIAVFGGVVGWRKAKSSG